MLSLLGDGTELAFVNALDGVSTKDLKARGGDLQGVPEREFKRSYGINKVRNCDDTDNCCTLTYSLKVKFCANASISSPGNGGAGAGANARASVAVASASEGPMASISPTGLMPPVVQSVFYDECKFRSYPMVNHTHEVVLKVVSRRGEHGILSPCNRGIQII